MSGKIEVEIDKIIWKNNAEKVVEIHFDEILIIGEYTIDSMFDDWFMVFVERNGSWKKISMFAENTSDLLNFLAEKYNLEVGQTQLANSAEWSSVISYPKLLLGKKLLKLVGEKIELEKDAEEYLAGYL